VLSRNTVDHTQERRGDLFRAVHNPDPALHPFEREREYMRALNATKLEKVFAKPFLGALSGHYDGVVCMAKHPASLSTLASGDMCGELRSWSVSTFACTGHAAQAHTGFVRGLAFATRSRLLSCGDDRAIREWEFPFTSTPGSGGAKPVATFLGQHAFTGLDVMRGSEATFATCGGSVVELWDRTRSEPVRTFEWGSESTHSVRFNPVETQLLASTAGDRSVALYDIRVGTALHKVVLMMRANAVAWNPREAFHFTCACDDSNLYTFDMRRCVCVGKLLFPRIPTHIHPFPTPQTAGWPQHVVYMRVTSRLLWTSTTHSLDASLSAAHTIAQCASGMSTQHAAKTSTTPHACNVSSASATLTMPALCSAAATTQTSASGSPALQSRFASFPAENRQSSTTVTASSVALLMRPRSAASHSSIVSPNCCFRCAGAETSTMQVFAVSVRTCCDTQVRGASSSRPVLRRLLSPLSAESHTHTLSWKSSHRAAISQTTTEFVPSSLSLAASQRRRSWR